MERGIPDPRPAGAWNGANVPLTGAAYLVGFRSEKAGDSTKELSKKKKKSR